ncbi:MAG: type I methionyl aminopeptidase [bacterium]|nr:type I methionyl aminopeptidase [bacterium]
MKLKSKEEIEIMREGGKRHAEILRMLTDFVEPGISTLTLETEARRLIKEGGDRPAFLGYTPSRAKRAFPAALCVSVNNEIVHGIPNEKPRVLHEGDIVSLDLGLVHKGLITDAAITVPVGAVDDEARRLIEVAEGALKEGIKAAQPGARIGDIGYAISMFVKQTNFTLAENLAGHGVGYAVHEEPFIPNVGERGKGGELVSGMVIAIEPMVNAGTGKIKLSKDGYTIYTRDGKKSAHFEHTVAITEKGNIILTQ